MSSAMSQTTTYDLLKFFIHRLAYARALWQLYQEQQQAIDQNNMDVLMETLMHKQGVMQAMGDLQQNHPDWVEVWKETRDTLPANVREQCEELFQETEKLIAQLLVMEQAGIEELTRRREEILTQLHEVSTFADAHHAYHKEIETEKYQLLDVDQ
jgi:hypothetical protein